MLVDAAIPTHFAILAPLFQRLQRDPRVHVSFSAADPDRSTGAAIAAGAAIRPGRRRRFLWHRFDLCIDAEPLDPAPLNRCRRRMTFQQGVAGRFERADAELMREKLRRYDRVAFVNGPTLRHYVDDRIVRPDQAALVGYPKADALVNGRYDASAVHAQLQLEMHRPTAIYAPTWSVESSLHASGERIVSSLLGSGFNVIVKLHDRSLAGRGDEPPVDWRARFAHVHQPGRVAFVEAADSSPFLAASDVLVTDHSSVGFEFCLLDRPIVVVDTPDLARAAGINPERIAQLRRAARVISHVEEAGAVALAEIHNPEHLSRARAEAARDAFHDPGGATARAMAAVYELLELAPWTLSHASPAHFNPAHVSL